MQHKCNFRLNLTLKFDISTKRVGAETFKIAYMTSSKFCLLRHAWTGFSCLKVTAFSIFVLLYFHVSISV